MKQIRLERINSAIMRAVSEAIFQAEYIDPACMVSVIRVETTPDLSFADVYFSVFSSDEGKRTAQFNALTENNKTIRHAVSQIMRELRIMPVLRFRLDSTLDYSEKIDRIISEVSPDKK